MWLMVLLLLCTVASAQEHSSRSAQFWAQVQKFVKTISPYGLRGPTGSGDIYWVTLEPLGEPRRLTQGGNYRTPVFDVAGHILALNDDALIRIEPAKASETRLCQVQRSLKLSYANAAKPGVVLVVWQASSGPMRVGLLSTKTCRIRQLPYDAHSEQDRSMVEHLDGSSRVYPDAELYVKREETTGITGARRVQDVFWQHRDALPLNISRCVPALCGQPSRSLDGRHAAFVKEQE